MIQKPNKASPPLPSVPKVVKEFAVKPWNTQSGKRVMIYGDTGMGKTSLARLAPKPVFLGLDEGGRELTDPITGNCLKRIEGLATFTDVRTALQQVSLYNDYETVVIDTVTILQDWAIEDVVATVKTKDGSKVTNIEGYGWKEGYTHLYNTMKRVLVDCDELVRRGKNIILVGQTGVHKVNNAGDKDFIRLGPRLYSGSASVEALYCEWVDYIFFINYYNVNVSKDKKVSGSTDRAVFVKPEVWFRAKSKHIESPVVSFENDADDTVWQFLFGGGK